MKMTDSHDPEADLDELAAGWIVEREEGFTPGRAEAFARWCGRDPRHAKAVARVEGTLALLNEMPAVRAPLEARIKQAAEKKQEAVVVTPAFHFNPWLWTAGLAAALVLGATGWWFTRSVPTAAKTYAANSAEPRRVALADGSVVDLNSNSRVQVQFSTGERHVTLASGEAHFQVAHNAARPFIVTARGVSVRAVGTAFNVRLLGDKVEVLVTEGKVEVDRADASADYSRENPIVTLLSAGKLTEITPNLDSPPHVEDVAPAVVHALLSWQDRMTSFSDVPLSEMVIRINRCNSTQIVLDEPELGDRRIGGVIDLNQVDAFVHLLEQSGDIVVERRSGRIFLHRVR